MLLVACGMQSKSVAFVVPWAGVRSGVAQFRLGFRLDVGVYTGLV